MKKIYSALALSLFFSISVNAQTASPKSDTSVVNPVKIPFDFSTEQQNQLNNLLNEQNYFEFYDKIKNVNIPPDSYIKYLSSKKNEGHVPVFWLMAEHHAKNNNQLEAHKWLYIAVIMTQQDSFLCADPTAKFAAQKLNRQFSVAFDIARKTPQHITPAMREVIYFMDNLKERSDPKWACVFGDNYDTYRGKTISRLNWKPKREEIYKKFIADYQK